jgi:hypothetical protein
MSTGEIEFTCPGCGTRLVMAASGAGTDVTCPSCSTLIAVPGLTSAVPTASDAPHAPFRRGHSRKLVVLGTLFLCIAAALSWGLAHRSGESSAAGDQSLDSGLESADAAESVLAGAPLVTEQPEVNAARAQLSPSTDNQSNLQEKPIVSQSAGASPVAAARQSRSLGAPLSFPLQFSERGYLATRVELGRQETPFRKEPAFGRNDRVVRRTLRVGPSPADLLGLAVNLSKRTLYLDLNQNQDLTDDAKGVYRSTTSACRFRNVRFCISNGGTNRCYLLDPLDLTVPERGFATIRSVYAGRIALHGQQWSLHVQDSLDGQFDARNRFMITGVSPSRQAGDTSYARAPASVSQHLFIAGHQYQFTFAYSPGEDGPLRVSVQEVSAPMGELALEGNSIRWLVLQGEACLALVDSPGKSLALPLDTYRLQSACVQPAPGVKPLVSSSGGASVTLEPGKVQSLKLGLPLVSSVLVGASRDVLTLRHVLRGAGGEVYAVPQSDRRNPPKFAVYLKDRLLATGSFKFG